MTLKANNQTPIFSSKTDEICAKRSQYFTQKTVEIKAYTYSGF